MPLTVICGGQFGSEGKGKLCAYLTLKDDVDAVVRCGSTNSGHTVVLDGQKWELRSIPTGFVNPKTLLLIPAGALIDLDILRKEVSDTGVTKDRLVIDQNAGVIEHYDIDAEFSLDLRGQYGSTQSGVGHALSRRVMRQPDFRIASQVDEFRKIATIGDVSSIVNGLLQGGKKVIIEGTQGYGLSLYHTANFPYATSRDTTAAGFLSEVGVSPRAVDDVILAVRTFPIRVSGNSGPLVHEITWEDVRSISGCPNEILELTTTTKRVRRVAEFDVSIVVNASRANGATMIALHGVDYLNYRDRGQKSFGELTHDARQFISDLENATSLPVVFIGTGPDNYEFIHNPLALRVNGTLSASKALG